MKPGVLALLLTFSLFAAGCPTDDIDECAEQLDDCGDHGTCHNEPGGYYCVCNCGYWEVDGICEDRWPQILFVDVNALYPGDGDCWTLAFDELGDALVVAQSGDEVWVADGEYVPGPDREDTFLISDDVEVYGGFAGNETERDQRDWLVNETILSGDIAGDGAEGFPWHTQAENSYHVVTFDGASASSLLHGVTVYGGNAEGADDDGGGAWLIASDARIEHVVFQDSWADGYGAAMAIDGGSPTIAECQFINGYSYGSGGIAAFGGGTPHITDSSFVDNRVDGASMLVLDGAHPVVERCTMTDGSGSWGGAILVIDASLTVLDSTLDGNSVGNDGGALWIQNGAVWIEGSTFTENNAEDFGAGVYCEDSELYVDDSTFRGNWTDDRSGGGIYSLRCSGDIGNSLFDDNSGSSGGGALLANSPRPTVHDCTFTDNTAVSGGGLCTASSTVERCTFEGNYAITGAAIDADTELTVVDCVFRDNESSSGGGALYLYETEATVIGCSFVGNTGAHGGAIDITDYDWWYEPLTVIDTTFDGNAARYGGAIEASGAALDFTNVRFSGNYDDTGQGSGGAIYLYDSEMTANNVSFSGNATSVEGGDVYLVEASATLDNCVLWGSTPGSLFVNNATVELYHTGIEGGWAGDGNLDLTADPFTDAAGPDGLVGTEDDDLTLAPGSVCVDGGDDASLPADWADRDADGDLAEPLPLDLAGNPRSGGVSVDMGAYEQ